MHFMYTSALKHRLSFMLLLCWFVCYNEPVATATELRFVKFSQTTDTRASDMSSVLVKVAGVV